MSVSSGIEITGIERLNAALTSALSLGQSRALMMRIAGTMQSQIQQTFDRQRDPITGSAWPPRKSGGGLDSGKTLHRSGNLRRSLLGTPTVTEDSVVIGSNLVYARIHNAGGVITATGSNRARPSQNPMLAIPLSSEARRIGSANVWWAWSERRGAKPFVFQSKNGNVLIATSSRGGGMTLHYVLKKSITIPQRQYLGWGPEYINQIGGVVAYALEQWMMAGSVQS